MMPQVLAGALIACHQTLNQGSGDETTARAWNLI